MPGLTDRHLLQKIILRLDEIRYWRKQYEKTKSEKAKQMWEKLKEDLNYQVNLAKEHLSK